MSFSVWSHVAATRSLIFFQLTYSAEHTLFVDIAIKAGVCTYRSDKPEDFIAVEYMNSLKLM